jgi:type III pantothenate kinase
MLLAIDIGNSSIKFGGFAHEKLVSKFTIPTVRQYSAEKINSLIAGKLNRSIRAVVISSVVPQINDAFRNFSEKYLETKPVFVNSNFDSGLKIRYDPPENLGVDRFVAAFAATEKYGVPCVICDFGTATTIDAVNSHSEFIGGTITPGISTLADALNKKTAKLPRVEIKKPASVFGNSTVSSIQSGIFYGYIGLTEGILRRMIDELGEKPRIIATGGFSGLIAENCELIEIVDENLVLEGLQMIYEKFSHELHKYHE